MRPPATTNFRAPAVARAGPLRAAVRAFRRIGKRLVEGRASSAGLDLHDGRALARLFDTHGPAAPGLAPCPGPNASGERVYDLRPDIRALLPLALTPAQRGDYLRWYLRHGRHEHDATPADLLHHLAFLDALPDRGLEASYRRQPDWQRAVPDALTVSGWPNLKGWLRGAYGLRERWFREARLCPAVESEASEGPGVNVLALFRYPSGLQRAAEELVRALQVAGVRTELRDVPQKLRHDGRARGGFDGLERHPITVVSMGLDYPLSAAYADAGLAVQPDTYRIGQWWWEVERLPADWRDRGEAVDEIWAPTAFVARALAELGKPVRTMLPSVSLPHFDRKPKEYFGLSPDRFTFGFAFDLQSGMARKNPLGLIEAFRRAFGRSNRVELAVKVMPPDDGVREDWRQLHAAAAAAGVRLIDRDLSREDVLGFFAACDAYASLHRAEGFGLPLAEAMLLGTPAIATAYSGNLDFMTPDNAWLVDCRPTSIGRTQYSHPQGATWAEPDLDCAAEAMRNVVDRPEEAAARADRGRRELQVLLSAEAAGARMAASLAEIRANLPARPGRVGRGA